MANPVRSSPYRVACALAPKKVRTFLTPSLIAACLAKGVEIVPVDPSRNLLEYHSRSNDDSEHDGSRDIPQKPPFDAVLHKVLTTEWAEQLRVFSARFPAIAARIVDPPEKIARVRDRATMLHGLLPDADTCQAPEAWKMPRETEAPAGGGGVVGGGDKRRDQGEASGWEIVPGCFVCVPQQTVVTVSELRRLAGEPGGPGEPGEPGAAESSAALQEFLRSQGLAFPLVAKPVQADGSTASHSLSLVFNARGLSELSHSLTTDTGTTSLTLPSATGADNAAGRTSAAALVAAETPGTCEGISIVLQQFINHGGHLVKLYVIGSSVRCVVRPSLPDVHPSQCQADVSPGYLPFSQVSNSPIPAPLPQPATDPPPAEPFSTVSITSSSSTFSTGAPWPGPLHHGMAEALGEHLRKQLGLRLFNVDIVRSVAHPSRFFIIDVNYFPGFAKLDGYEDLLSSFLLDLLHNE